MKGLLKNNFFGAMGSAMVSLSFFVVFGIVVIVTANSSLLLIFGLVCIPIFAINALSAFRKESATNWNKYIIVAPVRRKDIVKSRYINHISWVLVGAILVAIFVAFMILIHGVSIYNNSVRDPLSLFGIGIGIPLLMGSVFYPAVHLIGADRSEILMIISLIAAIGITTGIIGSINMYYSYYYGYDSMSDPEFLMGMAVYIGIVILFFILSYFLSLLINRKKEY